MVNKKDSMSTDEHDLGDVYASVRILSALTNLAEFRGWLKEEKMVQDSEQLVRGIGFFCEVALLSLASSVAFDNSLGLTESFAFYRANFHGDIDIDELPNDCEKTILIKRIKIVLKSVRKCKSWYDLERVLRDIETLIGPLREGIEKHVSPRFGLSVQEAKDFVTKRHLFVFFQNTEWGLPIAYLQSPHITKRLSSLFLAEMFDYYVVCLEYVWKNILGASFANSMMSKIHEELPRFIRDAERFLAAQESRFYGPFLAKPSELDVATDQRNEAPSRRHSEKERVGFVSWLALDILSRKAYHDELAPFEESLGSASWTSPILTMDRFDKSSLAALLSNAGLNEPAYFSGKDWESKRKLLDYYFLWYPIKIVDSSNTEIFGGVPAFLSVVMGGCALRDSLGGDSPIEIRVFKHPMRRFEEGFEYSYAVLIEVHGALSDSSGWLVFNDCAGEYPGDEDTWLPLVRTILERMEKDRDIIKKEIIIDLESFKRYLQETGRVMAETARGARLMESREVIESQRELISASRGKLFEYVFYRWLTKQKGYSEVMGPGEFKDVQIDCIGIRDSDIDVFECKVNLHRDTIPSVIRQIQRKNEEVKSKFPGKASHPYVVVYHKVDALDKQALNSRGIGIIDDFRSKIWSLDVHKQDRNEILRILDYDVARIIE